MTIIIKENVRSEIQFGFDDGYRISISDRHQRTLCSRAPQPPVNYCIWDMFVDEDYWTLERENSDVILDELTTLDVEVSNRTIVEY